jgi:hypothetical protein
MLACRIMAPVSLVEFRVLRRALASVNRRFVVLAALALAGCAGSATSVREARVTVTPAADGVALSEAGHPVLFYRSRPAAGREPWRTHYVHPLYSVGGAVVTEDGPADHLHQRGVYWAWRRILVDGVRVADGWVGDKLVLEVGAPATQALPDGSAQIDVRVLWRAPVGETVVPIIEENSTIRAWPSRDGRRRLAFDVRLRALRDGVALAGTDDEKGYGGFSLRFANAPSVLLEGDGRELHATQAGLDAGRVVTFRWPSASSPWPARIAASCRVNGQPWTRWVLRQEASMQNCAFPGSQPVAVPTQTPLRLEATVEIE